MIRFIPSTGRARHAAAAASFLAIVLLGGSALAADPAGGKGTAPEKPAAGAAQDPMMEAMMKFATPGPEHAVLQPLVGRWKSVTKMWTGPGDPQVSEGTSERSWVMGGRYMVGKYAGEFGGMPFEGMEILGYDKMHGQYVATWIDNMGTGIAASSSGTWDPAARTLTILITFDDPVSGKPTTLRNLTRIVDDNSYVFSIIGKMDGKDYTQMETTYTRVQ